MMESTNPPPEPLPEPKPDNLLLTKEKKVGDTYKITGGKYKKFGSAVLKVLNKTYSDCELPKDKCEHYSQIANIVKIKNDYLLAENPIVVEMPEAENLQVVENLDTYLKDNPEEAKQFSVKATLNEILDEEEPVGKLEVDEQTGEVQDNITECCPSITEALKLKNENKELKDQVEALKNQCELMQGQIHIEMQKGQLNEQKVKFLKQLVELHF
jgi:hypothetical protein